MDAPFLTRITQAEFNRLVTLPENQDRQLELWNGEIVETMPSRLHSLIQSLLARLIGNFLDANPIGIVYTELQIDLEGEDYSPVPDVAVVLTSQGESDWHSALPFMPALVVEIQSPDQSDKFMRDKADYYSTHGCPLVITIYIKRTVEIRTQSDVKLLVPGDTLKCDPVLPGFSIEVASLFPPT
jgi:Uma2 family endonuclease